MRFQHQLDGKLYVGLNQFTLKKEHDKLITPNPNDRFNSANELSDWKMFNCCLFFEALVKLRGDDDVDDEVAEMKEEAQKESSTQKVRHPNS